MREKIQVHRDSQVLFIVIDQGEKSCFPEQCFGQAEEKISPSGRNDKQIKDKTISDKLTNGVALFVREPLKF